MADVLGRILNESALLRNCKFKKRPGKYASLSRLLDWLHVIIITHKHEIVVTPHITSFSRRADFVFFQPQFSTLIIQQFYSFKVISNARTKDGTASCGL